MLSRKVRRLSLPAFALVVAILASTGLMLVTHLRSLGREKERMQRDLQRQSTIVLRTLESSARAGMMMHWGREQFQALLEEASQLKEISYVGILDYEGHAVVSASIFTDAPPWPEPDAVRRVIDGEGPHFADRRLDGRGVFEVTQKFVPRVRRRPMGRMMGPAAGRFAEDPLPAEDPRWAVVLGLNTGPWEEVLQQGRRQALLSLFVLAATGSVALYVGIVLQNYFVVRRTLGEMRAYSQNVLENMADGLISVDVKGRVSTFNGEALRILGGPEKPLQGQDLRLLLPDVAAMVQGVLEGRGNTVERELTLGEGEAAKPVGITLSPLWSEEGEITGAVVLLRDLTEVRRLQRQVGEAEKLAALGQMAATVAHEVRNPLSSLRGFAQLFEKKFDAGSPEEGYARLMVAEVDRLNRTVSDLLFYSRPLDLSRQKVALGSLLRETLKLLGPDIEASGQKVDTGSLDDPVVEGDPDQLRRAFLNVLLNAHQAAGPGGAMTVRAAARPGGLCRVEIGDDGPGMSADEAERAFEPFFTTREKGSGLGLAIVKKIVDLHGGSVSLDGGQGRGMTVTIDLPA